MHAKHLVASLLFLATLPVGNTTAQSDSETPISVTWADSVLASLSLEEKVSQLFATYAEGGYHSTDDPEFRRLSDLVERFGVGGIVFFKSDPLGQAILTNELQKRSTIPLLISQDMEWGPAMRISRSTEFPYSMALGATRNPQLAYAMGRITAREARSLGIHQVYAPVADINNNPDNPVINIRSFGESPELVSEMVVSLIKGLQDGGVIATAKHFPGHGDASVDSHLNLPVLNHDMSRLQDVELVPFKAAIDAGVRSIMTGHLSFPMVDKQEQISAALSPTITTGILREQMGFSGLIVTDALNMAAVTKQFGPGEAAVRAIAAGADVILLSVDEYAARSEVLRAVKEGTLSDARIDESVRRVLETKQQMGLPRQRLVDMDSITQVVGNQTHRIASETIARESITLLKNDDGVIPLDHRARVGIVTLTDKSLDGESEFASALISGLGDSTTHHYIGPDADNVSSYAIMKELEDRDMIVVGLYLGRKSGKPRQLLRPRQTLFLRRLAEANKKTAIVLFGNPFALNELSISPSATVLTYGKSVASQKAAANALLGQIPIAGQLPVTIPGRNKFGDGLTLDQTQPRIGLPDEVGMTREMVDRIDSLLHGAIADRSFPGAAVAIGRPGVTNFSRAYGFQTYDSAERITEESIFDLASITKVVATTTAVMMLYESGELALDSSVVTYLPEFGQAGKDEITVRHLLTHSSGLAPFRRYYEMPEIKKRIDLVNHIMEDSLSYEPGTRVRYSDLGIITLGLVVEAVTGRPLDKYASEEIFEPLAMRSTGFTTTLDASLESFVPTEVDTTFRMQLMKGAVHDEAAYIMGGVAGHAGLFSNLKDLTRFAHMMLNKGKIGELQFLQPETIETFTSLAPNTERGLGWDIRSSSGYSSAGSLFGPRSYGHTGFTGTSIWIDPDAQVFTILLTNRVHPTRANQKIRGIRPKLADIVFESIVGDPEPLLPASPGSGQ